MTGGKQETFLGLDIGTSSVKALLVDADQRVVAEASTPLNVSRPFPLWSEQNPDDWVEGVEAAVAAIRRHAPTEFAALAGVGLSGQMHGATLLDAHDKPLRPAILWNDGRSFAECIELKRRVPDLEQRTGNLAMPGFTAPKMLWVAAHEPEIARATRRVLLPKDYVRLRLSGEAVSEMSDASGTLWLDVGRRRWDAGLLAATGLTEKAMPSLVEGSEVSAYLAPDTAAAWGLAGRKIPIAGGGGDNAASAIGVGATAAGAGFVSLGTSGVIFSATDRFVSLPERTLHAFCHALPHRWHGMAVMLSAASSLSWLAALLGREQDIGKLIAGAAAFARSKSAVASAPIFLPYLSGERTPHNDAEATGMFVGLQSRAQRRCAGLRGHGGGRLLVRRRRRRSGRRRRPPGQAAPGWRRGAVGILGPDDRRRHRADHRPCLWSRGWRCARRRPAWHAGRRGGNDRGGMRAAAGPDRVQARPGAGCDPCAAHQALSRDLSGRKDGANRLSKQFGRTPG